MKFKLFSLFGILLTLTSFAQEKKQVEAMAISIPLTIDAVLDEECYMVAQPAKDFVQLQPYNGRPSYHPTEAFFFYDQDAIYVGVMMYDSAPDSIYNYMTERDNIWRSDYFGVYIDPYNQGQLAYGFFINPAGIQADMKAIKKEHYDNEDGSWNAVWQSKTRITDNGWIVEMRIPYSMLRFPEKEVHTWGLNMFRNIRRLYSNNSWNLVDREVSGFIHQQGELTGIKNIKPPVRLSLSPYASGYLEYSDGATTPDFVYKGGMDLKYGLSESFTLDMMLIPDFGQIQSDDQRLNLSPYEIYYSERRQFFNEGTELFERGDIFYSRRIGGTPKFIISNDDIDTTEILDYNPSETQLLNATKISGRTSKGYGLGVLNAMTLPAYATIKDTITGEKREVLTQPFTNYNVSVIDKSLKNNSYFSIINSNVSMNNNPFMANVTATEFQFRDKSKTYALKGKGGISTRGDTDRENGFFAELGLEKNQGKLRYGIEQEIMDNKFNNNDLGYNRRNNELETEAWISYNITEPFSIFKEWRSNVWWEYTRIYKPSDVYGHEAGMHTYAFFKNNYGVSFNSGFSSVRNDYYEPRVEGRYYRNPYDVWCNGHMHTDRRKRLRGYWYVGGYNKPTSDQNSHWTGGGVNIRVGQRLDLDYDLGWDRTYNNRGYVNKNDAEDTIHFSRRHLKEFQHVFTTSYAISNNMSVRLRTRHYWSSSLNKDFYILQDDGSLVRDNNYTENHDANYNAFTVDMIFRWIFAPGSEISIAWKNSIYHDDDVVINDYFTNLDKTWNSDQTNSISIKILYYLDYNSLRKKNS